MPSQNLCAYYETLIFQKQCWRMGEKDSFRYVSIKRVLRHRLCFSPAPGPSLSKWPCPSVHSELLRGSVPSRTLRSTPRALIPVVPRTRTASGDRSFQTCCSLPLEHACCQLVSNEGGGSGLKLASKTRPFTTPTWWILQTQRPYWVFKACLAVSVLTLYSAMHEHTADWHCTTVSYY